MKKLDEYPLSELKQIYNLLHAQLPENPELMDSELLHELQQLLQSKAKEQGIDVSHHGQWSGWLQGGPNLRGI